MNSGYYAACAGLRTQTQALEVLANNLANINTQWLPRTAAHVSLAAGRRRRPADRSSEPRHQRFQCA
ncbi:MAG: hypothetical protein DMG97_33000, partial [Acidobacteria bacterium]